MPPRPRRRLPDRSRPACRAPAVRLASAQADEEGLAVMSVVGDTGGESLDLTQLDTHYESVGTGFLRGRVTPVLGAGVNLCGRPPLRGDEWLGKYPPSGHELAAYLASQFKYPA